MHQILVGDICGPSGHEAVLGCDSYTKLVGYMEADDIAMVVGEIPRAASSAHLEALISRVIRVGGYADSEDTRLVQLLMMTGRHRGRTAWTISHNLRMIHR
jgi:hypothetical protein